MKKIFFTAFFAAMAFLNVNAQMTYIVDQAGGGNYTTISDAIKAAVAGDTIKVLPGVFSEQITINKNLCLVGKDSTAIIMNNSLSTISFIAGSNGASIYNFRISSGIVIASGIDNITIGSNIFENATITANIAAAGLTIKNNRFTSCTITTSNQTKKIYLFGNTMYLTNVTISTDKSAVSIIYNNKFEKSSLFSANTKEGRSYVYGNSMALGTFNTYGLIISNNTMVSGNDISIVGSSYSFGIRIYGSGNMDDIKILGNHIHGETGSDYARMFIIENSVSNYSITRVFICNNILSGQKNDGNYGQTFFLFFHNCRQRRFYNKE